MESAFLAAILTNPHNPNPRLVYADWLEEQGDATGRAAYIRASCAAAQTYDCYTANVVQRGVARAELVAEAERLFRAQWLVDDLASWFGNLPLVARSAGQTVAIALVATDLSARTLELVFRRGLPEGALLGNTWHQHLAVQQTVCDLLPRLPLHEVWAPALPDAGLTDALLQCPGLTRLVLSCSADISDLMLWRFRRDLPGVRIGWRPSFPFGLPPRCQPVAHRCGQCGTLILWRTGFAGSNLCGTCGPLMAPIWAHLAD